MHADPDNSHGCSDHHGEGPTVYDLPGFPRALREHWRQLKPRRYFLGRMGKTLGWASLATLLGPRLMAAGTNGGNSLPSPDSLRLPHFAPKAKRCINLFMSGAPSQMDLWDDKPRLAELFNKDLPDSVRGNQALTGMTAGQSRFPIAPSHWKF